MEHLKIAQSSKGLPVLDDTDYEVWKKSIDVWELLTDLNGKKRGFSILSMRVKENILTLCPSWK